MKKTKLTRSLLAACSIVALSAVMYGCTGDGSENDLTATQGDLERAEMERDAALAAQAAAEAAQATAEMERDAANAAAAAAAEAQATAEGERDAANAAAAAAAMAQADAEATQAAAEMAQATAEAAQMAAELAQAEAEAAQARAEMAQAEAEAARMMAEAARMTAEAAAAVSEQARMDAEAGRTAAEAARAAAAAAQATAEAERDAANMARDAAVAAQMAAEAERDAAEADAMAAEARADAAEAEAADAKMAQEEAEKKADEESKRADDLQQRDDDAAAAAAVKSAGALYRGLGWYFLPPSDRDFDGDIDDDDNFLDVYGWDGVAPKTGFVGLDPVTGAPTRLDNTLEAAEDGDLTLGSWTGTMYEGKSPVGEAHPVEYMAVVYTTQDDEGGEPFFHLYGSATEDTNGYLEFGPQATVDDAFTGDDTKVSGFPTAGTRTYDVLDEVDGTYDGAPGRYVCVGTTCDATAIETGGFTLSVAVGASPVWRFYPDAGAEVPRPDSTYQSFGWWLERDVTPDLDWARAYVILEKSEDLQAATFDQTVQGTAEYSGHAVGKYAIYSALLDEGEAGHFTADAMLEADFGGDTGADGTDLVTVTGTIDNFMTGDGAKPWSVELSNGVFPGTTATDGTGSGALFAGSTTWRIEGVSDTGDGAFGGMFHNNPLPPIADGTIPARPPTYIPDEVGGTFDAQFESATGRMIGAFAATRD